MDTVNVQLRKEDVELLEEAMNCLILQYKSSLFTQDMDTTIRIQKKFCLMEQVLKNFQELSKVFNK